MSVNSASRRFEAEESDIIKNTTDNLDSVRVEIHNVIAVFFDKEKFGNDDELNNILNSLGHRIGLPLPAKKMTFMPAKVSPETISEKELMGNFDELVEKYGEKLSRYLIEQFSEVDSDE